MLAAPALRALSGLVGPPPRVDLNPLHWLGDAASSALSDVWKSSMIALWSAALWVLRLAFSLVDLLTTPDLSGSGPLGGVLPTTLWLGVTVAGLMLFVQLALAAFRRDGSSLGQVVVGALQFGAVWVTYLVVGAGLVTAAAGLHQGILASMLHTGAMTGALDNTGWPREVGDVTVATVLGMLSVLLVLPAAFAYLLIMLVREAALVILIATAPITAAGLLSETTKSWFWKSLRWFFATLLISPVAALVLGIGVRLSAGVVGGAGDSTAQAAGAAVVGVAVVAIGAVTPLALYRLLAFVEPGTASGAALRQSWSEAGGVAGLLGGAAAGGAGAGGSGAAASSAGDGRSGGESGAEAQTAGRFASLLGAAGTGVQAAVAGAHKAAAVAGDVLGQTGVGASSYQPYPEGGTSSLAGAQAGRGAAGPAPGQPLSAGEAGAEQPAASSTSGQPAGAAGGVHADAVPALAGPLPAGGGPPGTPAGVDLSWPSAAASNGPGESVPADGPAGGAAGQAPLAEGAAAVPAAAAVAV